MSGVCSGNLCLWSLCSSRLANKFEQKSATSEVLRGGMFTCTVTSHSCIFKIFGGFPDYRHPKFSHHLLTLSRQQYNCYFPVGRAALVSQVQISAQTATILLHSSRGFSLFLQTNYAKTVSFHILSNSLPSNNPTIEAIQSELLTPSLNNVWGEWA